MSLYDDFNLGPVSKKDCLAMAEQAEAAAKEYDTTRRFVGFDISKAREKLNQQLKQFTGGALDSVRGALNEGYNADRRRVLKNSEQKRYEHLAKLKALADAAQSSHEFFSNPLVVATAHGVGDHRRSRIYSEVKDQPPAALRTLAKTAAATNDRDLASAVIAANEARKSEDRAFDSHALAERLWGEDCRASIDYLKIVARQYDEALRQNRELETGKTDGLLSISLGLRERQSPSIAASEVEPSEAV